MSSVGSSHFGSRLRVLSANFGSRRSLSFLSSCLNDKSVGRMAIWKWCYVLLGWIQWAECMESRVAMSVVQGVVQGEGQVLSPMRTEMD